MALDRLFDWPSLALFVCFLLIVWIYNSKKPTSTKFAGAKPLPGPWGIPLLGNMLSIGRSPPHISLTNLSKKFGPIYQIRLGSRTVLVLNGYDAINKALLKQSSKFAGRPQLFSTDAYLSCCPGKHNLTLGSSGERYMLHRKLAEASLRHFTAGSQTNFVESVVISEAMKLIERVRSEYIPKRNENVQSSDLPEMRNDICLTVANIMCRFLFGERCSYDDMKMKNLLLYTNRFSEANKTGNINDFLPWLRFLTKNQTREYISSLKDLRKAILDMVKTHQEEYTPGSNQDILDHLVTSGRYDGKEKMEKVGLTEEMLLDTAVDFVGAGFETTSSTFEWCILYLAAHPNIQAALQRNVDEIIGRDRLPSLADRADLPLVEAFILEVQRHSNMVPFSFPHSTMEDTVLDGFFIPKGVIVFVNFYSAHIDPSVWTDPDTFNPHRFMCTDGTLDTDKRNHVIPFGVGRRRCLGADLARMELFLFVCLFIQQLSFERSLEEGSMEAEEGLNRRPKKLSVQIRSRMSKI